ncbi:MAG: hypothetical protein AAGI72_06850 [Pseudomonadota bacterium]
MRVDRRTARLAFAGDDRSADAVDQGGSLALESRNNSVLAQGIPK